jgi:hypothetical protein
VTIVDVNISGPNGEHLKLSNGLFGGATSVYWGASEALKLNDERITGFVGAGYASFTVTGGLLRELLLEYDPETSYKASATAADVEEFVAGLVDGNEYSISVYDF